MGGFVECAGSVVGGCFCVLARLCVAVSLVGVWLSWQTQLLRVDCVWWLGCRGLVWWLGFYGVVVVVKVKLFV